MYIIHIYIYIYIYIYIEDLRKINFAVALLYLGKMTFVCL